MDFVQMIFTRKWFEDFFGGEKPELNTGERIVISIGSVVEISSGRLTPLVLEIVYVRVYNEQPLYLGNPSDRAVIRAWCNSFRAHQYSLLKRKMVGSE